MDISTYLAKGVSLQDVMIKQNREQAAVVNMIIATTRGPEFDWLKGKVGGGRDLFAEHRAQILAWAQVVERFSTCAHSHGETPPLRDPESGSIVDCRTDLARQGFGLVIDDLDKALGKTGRINKMTLSLYWLCWIETAGNVLNLMKYEEILKPFGLGVYSLL